MKAIMRDYELMLVLSAKEKWDDEKKVKPVITELFGDTAVKVTDLVLHGTKSLAYPINKQTEAVYVVANISCENLSIGEIERHVRQMPHVLRYLLTRKEG